MDTRNLVAWLPFDDSPTFDWCGNEWTLNGALNVDSTNAISGNALQLDGSGYLQNDSIAAKIGDDSWTFHWHATCTATRTEGYFFGTYNANYGTSGAGNNKWVSVCYLNGNPRLVLYGNDVQAGVSLTLGQRYHYALSYDGTNLRFFIDGQLKITKAANVKLGGIFRIGNDPCRSNQFTGSIDEFMILKGVAWTENFTPPTAEDYDISDGVPINFTVDLQRRVKNALLTWRYENAGDADDLILASTVLTDLPATQSITGTAFYQTTGAKCFDIPATPEIWLKFDVYFNGSNRWRAYNGGDNGITGITAQTTNTIYFFSNRNEITGIANAAKKNQLQTVLLHMISGTTDGIVEAWVDGDFIYRYTGNVNQGNDFADIYLQSDGSGTFFSNVIISNAEIGLDEDADAFEKVDFTVDLQRRVTNVEDYLVDLQREVNNPLFFRSEYLKVWLPFDRLATEDLCGRDWQAIGTPTIDTTNAVVGNALQLDGSSYLQKTDGITLGGKSFTIHLWCSFKSSSGAAATFFSAQNSQTGAYLYINRYGTWDYWVIIYSDGGTSIPVNFYGCGYDTLNHFAVVYDHDSGELAAYCNGGNTITYNLTIPETFFDVVRVGTYLQGSIDELQIYDGIALWTENFTPPTADFYSLEPSEPVDFTVDLQRRVTNDTIKFKPEVFASWIPTGEIYFKPEVFASIINDGTPLDFTADLSRNVTRTESFTADLQRSLTEVNAFTVDTQRTITRSVNMRVDIQRKLSNAVDFTADAQRSLINRVDFSIDLQRTLVQLNDFTVDLQRQTVWEWLTRILPESSFLDDKMLASAKALDVQITKFHQSIREVLHLPRLDELSGTILDLLAEQFHVDYYDAINFSDEEKRNLIRQSIAWHRLKGTPAAVEMVLQDAFKDLRIDEWFTYGGEPYFFRLWTKGYISTPERFKSFWLMFMDAKNVRSQLEMVTIDHSHDEPIQLYTGVAKVTSGLKIIDLPKHDDAKINLHTGVAIVNVGQKIIGLPKHNDIHTKIYSGVYQIHTGTIFIGMKRNPF